jgi:hypothetical protein
MPLLIAYPVNNPFTKSKKIGKPIKITNNAVNVKIKLNNRGCFFRIIQLITDKRIKNKPIKNKNGIVRENNPSNNTYLSVNERLNESGSNAAIHEGKMIKRLYTIVRRYANFNLFFHSELLLFQEIKLLMKLIILAIKKITI